MVFVGMKMFQQRPCPKWRPIKVHQLFNFDRMLFYTAFMYTSINSTFVFLLLIRWNKVSQPKMGSQNAYSYTLFEWCVVWYGKVKEKQKSNFYVFTSALFKMAACKIDNCLYIYFNYMSKLGNGRTFDRPSFWPGIT